MKHPPELVSRIKGLILYCGVSPKTLAAKSGVSIWTIRDWMRGAKQRHIEPDPQAASFLIQALNIEGDKS